MTTGAPLALTKRQLKKALQRIPADKKRTMLRSIVQSKVSNDKDVQAYREKYSRDPLAWVQDYVNIQLAEYQLRPFAAVRDGFRRIATYGPHGLGKSVICSLMVLWGVSTHAEIKIPTTASAWRQLIRYMWPEIHKWYGEVRWGDIGEKPDILKLALSCGSKREAFAIASDRPETLEGAHAARVMYIFDEAKIIPAGTWEAAEGAFSTPGAHLQLAFSTPGEPSGVFYSICSRQHGYENWKVIHVSLRDTIRAGRVSLDWARQCRAMWGPTSTAYQQRVWGLFVKDSDDAIIPLSWVEAAVARWHSWHEAGAEPEGSLEIGADTAGQGRDKTVFAYRYGRVIAKLERFGKSRPMEIAGKLKNAMGADGIVKIDIAFGEGAGTADRLTEFDGMRKRVFPVHAAHGTEKVDRSGLLTFANTRAAMWWNVRELLDPANGECIALPDDPKLIGDLTAPKRKERSDGKLLVEPKEDIIKRLGRSPDDGDAVCLALWPVRVKKTYIAVG